MHVCVPLPRPPLRHLRRPSASPPSSLRVPAVSSLRRRASSGPPPRLSLGATTRNHDRCGARSRRVRSRDAPAASRFVGRARALLLTDGTRAAAAAAAAAAAGGRRLPLLLLLWLRQVAFLCFSLSLWGQIAGGFFIAGAILNVVTLFKFPGCDARARSLPLLRRRPADPAPPSADFTPRRL